MDRRDQTDGSRLGSPADGPAVAFGLMSGLKLDAFVSQGGTISGVP